MAEWDALPIEKAAVAYRKLATRPDANEPAASEPSSQVDMALALGGSRITQAVADGGHPGRRAAAQADPAPGRSPLPGRLSPLIRGALWYRARGTACSSCWTRISVSVHRPRSTAPPPGEIPVRRLCASKHCTTWPLLPCANRQLVVELDEERLCQLESWTPTSLTAPQSLDLSLFVVAASATDVDDGRFQVVVGPNLGAIAAGRNLGRFADLLGEEAMAAFQAVGRAEVLPASRLSLRRTRLSPSSVPLSERRDPSSPTTLRDHPRDDPRTPTGPRDPDRRAGRGHPRRSVLPALAGAGCGGARVHRPYAQQHAGTRCLPLPRRLATRRQGAVQLLRLGIGSGASGPAPGTGRTSCAVARPSGVSMPGPARN